MPRLPLVSRKDVTDPVILHLYNRKFGTRDPAVDPGTTGSGAPGNYEAVFAHSPDIFEHVISGFYVKMSKKRKLPLVYMEMAIARVGWNCSCRWMFSEHSKGLRGIDVPEDVLTSIPNWSVVPEKFTPEQRAVLAYTDCLTLDHGRTPDGIFEQLKKYFDHEQIIELTYITGMFMNSAHMIKALRLEHDDYEENVREMPSPPGYKFNPGEPAPLPKRS